ncbi:MAG: hypothetical protein K6L81_01795 [Agarilytica sp.]
MHIDILDIKLFKFVATRTLESGEREVINVVGEDVEDAQLVAMDKSKHISERAFSIEERM